MNTQKELKQEYAEQIINNSTWRDSKRMQDHCIKNAAWIVKFENGDLVSFDKPSIQKDFCYGYSLSIYDSESYDNANRLAENARHDVDNFMKENLSGIEQKLEAAKNGLVCYGDHHWYGDLESCTIKFVQFVKPYDFYNDEEGKYKRLSEADIATYIEGIEEVKKGFIKRLNTYLKKYGLSKVNTWSYWRDL